MLVNVQMDVKQLNKFPKIKPDVLLLDVQMPEMNGFQVLESLGKNIPYVIFVTAYDQYAIQAFEVYALDYLLKPFNENQTGTCSDTRTQTSRSGKSNWLFRST